MFTIKFDDTNFTNPTHVGTIGHSYNSSSYDLSIGTLGSGDSFTALSLTDDGSRLAVGAMKDDGANGGHSNAGAVYLITFDQTTNSDGNPSTDFNNPTHVGTIGIDYAPTNTLTKSLDLGDNGIDILSNNDQFGNSLV